MEILSDFSLEQMGFRLTPLPGGSGEGKFHYAGCLDSAELEAVISMDDVFAEHSRNIAERLLHQSVRGNTEIMGIINMTPDSFYSGSRYLNDPDGMREVILNSDIVDVGGESTRPGSEAVPIDVEIERVKGALRLIRDYGDINISLDTMHPEVVEAALRYDINYINDVTGFRNEKMVKLASDEHLGCIVMHMRGTPSTMMSFTRYDDIVSEVVEFLSSRARTLLKAGIPLGNIVVDPGIGFAKDYAGNMDILRNIRSFSFGFRTLVGHSRKSFIGTLIGDNRADRLAATLSVSLYLKNRGVDIIRVHDPLAHRHLFRTFSSLTE